MWGIMLILRHLKACVACVLAHSLFSGGNDIETRAFFFALGHGGAFHNFFTRLKVYRKKVLTTLKSGVLSSGLKII